MVEHIAITSRLKPINILQERRQYAPSDPIHFFLTTLSKNIDIINKTMHFPKFIKLKTFLKVRSASPWFTQAFPVLCREKMLYLVKKWFSQHNFYLHYILIGIPSNSSFTGRKLWIIAFPNFISVILSRLILLKSLY